MARKLVQGWRRINAGDGGPLVRGFTYVPDEERVARFQFSDWNLVGQGNLASEADLLKALGADGVISPAEVPAETSSGKPLRANLLKE